MIEGKAAYRYARRRLGFFTYWRCRIEDAVRNEHLVWRSFDAVVAVATVGATAYWGNGWLASCVLMFGLWNFTDGMVRTRW